MIFVFNETRLNYSTVPLDGDTILFDNNAFQVIVSPTIFYYFYFHYKSWKVRPVILTL